MNTLLLHILLGLGYFWGALRLLNSIRVHKDSYSGNHRKLTQTLVFVTLVIHLTIIYFQFSSELGLYFGILSAISIIFAFSSMAYWFYSFLYRIDMLYLLILLFTGLFSILNGLFPPTRLIIESSSVIFRAHFALSLAAYSMFTIAGLHTILIALEQKYLTAGKISFYVMSLPPVLTMEKILFNIICMGFIPLSISLLTGMFFLEELTGQILAFNHKILFGISSWIIFGLLILGRVLLGWRGKTAIKWTLAGYSCLLLAYLGSSFVAEIILNKQG